MWFYIEFPAKDGSIQGACFVHAESAFSARWQVNWNGWAHPLQSLKITSLPRLAGEIPDYYMERLLDQEDLQELDRYLGGDGTCTMSIEDRDLPWATK